MIMAGCSDLISPNHNLLTRPRMAPPQLSSGRRPRPWQRPSHFRAVDEDDAMMTLSLQDDVTKIEMSGETDIQR